MRAHSRVYVRRCANTHIRSSSKLHHPTIKNIIYNTIKIASQWSPGGPSKTPGTPACRCPMRPDDDGSDDQNITV